MARLRVWLIALTALLIGVVIGAVLWAIVTHSKFDWSWSAWPTIIALITLGGVLVTALATVALAWSTRTLAQSAQDQAKATNQELEVIRAELQVAKEQTKHLDAIGGAATFFTGIAVGAVVGSVAYVLNQDLRKRLRG